MFSCHIASFELARELTNSDYDYMIDRIMHSRHLTEHKMHELEGIADYERMKTIATYVKQLQSTNMINFAYLLLQAVESGEVKVEAKAELCNVIFHDKFEYELLGIKFYFIHEQNGSMHFDVYADILRQSDDIRDNHKERSLVLVDKYPVEPNGIISYDMVFDQPSQFIYKLHNLQLN